MHQIVCRLGLCPKPHWGKDGGEGKKEEGEVKERSGGVGRGGSPGMPKSRVGKPNVTVIILTVSVLQTAS